MPNDRGPENGGRGRPATGLTLFRLADQHAELEGSDDWWDEARARAVAIEICNRVRVRLVAEVMVQETPLGH